MTRVYHPFDKWECYQHNFYGGVLEYKHDDSKQLYASLLKDLKSFEEALQIVITEWEYSCSHNLTNEGMNRIAWLGQASCALVFNVPYNVSQGGYNLLTSEEQQAADAMAQKYLNKWLEEHELIKDV